MGEPRGNQEGWRKNKKDERRTLGKQRQGLLAVNKGHASWREMPAAAPFDHPDTGETKPSAPRSQRSSGRCVCSPHTTPRTGTHAYTSPGYVSHCVTEAMVMETVSIPPSSQQGLTLQLAGKYWVAWGTKALGFRIPLFLVNTQCCLHNWNWLDTVRNV